MGLSIAVLDAENCFQALVSYSFTNVKGEKELSEAFNEILQSEVLLQKKYHKTQLFWAFPESIIMPPEFINDDSKAQMLDLVFGDAKKGIIKTDFLYKHNLHHVYRIPQTIETCFAAKFPDAMQTHQYSLLVNREMQQGNHLFAIIYAHSLTVMLYKAGKFQLIQNFSYTFPDDTAYHLLNICKSHDVFPSTVKLHIAGFIDENSNLYAAMYKYFLNIELDGLSEAFTYREEIKNHPPHFFSHLFAMASCV